MGTYAHHVSRNQYKYAIQTELSTFSKKTSRDVDDATRPYSSHAPTSPIAAGLHLWEDYDDLVEYTDSCADRVSVSQLRRYLTEIIAVNFEGSRHVDPPDCSRSKVTFINMDDYAKHRYEDLAIWARLRRRKERHLPILRYFERESQREHAALQHRFFVWNSHVQIVEWMRKKNKRRQYLCSSQHLDHMSAQA